MCKILIRTSLARGGSTCTVSSLSGSPAAQQTAALQVIVFPVVSDMVVVEKRVVEKSKKNQELCTADSYNDTLT